MIEMHALLLTTKWNKNAMYPLVFTMRGTKFYKWWLCGLVLVLVLVLMTRLSSLSLRVRDDRLVISTSGK